MQSTIELDKFWIYNPTSPLDRERNFLNRVRVLLNQEAIPQRLSRCPTSLLPPPPHIAVAVMRLRTLRRAARESASIRLPINWWTERRFRTMDTIQNGIVLAIFKFFFLTFLCIY